MMWIFGYGSLLWKTDFPYEEQVNGYIKGYIRRFWQASEDHRGKPGAPGRVVTIIPSNNLEDKVYGIAYRIAESDVSQVLEYLNYREKDGYEQKTVTFYPCDRTVQPFELKIYIADKSNPFYVGPAPLEEIAMQILTAEGPSGKNDEYLYMLAETTKNLFPTVKDEHLFQLVELVKKFKDESVGL